MKIRLTRKLAEFIDGVDLRSFQVGDVVDLTAADANLLLAEGWATESDPSGAVLLNRAPPSDRPPGSARHRSKPHEQTHADPTSLARPGPLETDEICAIGSADPRSLRYPTGSD